MNFNQETMWMRLQNKPGNYYTESSESEREEFRTWTKGLLDTTKVTVEFTKANGESRTMVCTLSQEHGAVYVINENQDSIKKKTQNNEVCVVWDCEQKAWRSFRWDRLKKIEFDV